MYKNILIKGPPSEKATKSSKNNAGTCFSTIFVCIILQKFIGDSCILSDAAAFKKALSFRDQSQQFGSASESNL